MKAAYEPTSLQEAIIYFADPDNCREYVVARRWPNGVTCPSCGCEDVIFLANQNRWQCRNKHSKRQFSLKTGTIYEDSPLGLDKWLTATWLVMNCKNGVSSCEIARALNITQKSAWFMDHRIRCAVGMDSDNKLSGHVEADETFIGGKARNMHVGKRQRRITGTGTKDKTAVMGILERGGNVRASVIPNRKSTHCRPKRRNTSKQVPRSTLMRYSATKGWHPTTRTKSSITQCNMLMDRSTLTVSKTSGHF
jgi:hypothetical protein